ncbi:MAG: primosomal protein N' [Bacteroidia bacterium]
MPYIAKVQLEFNESPNNAHNHTLFAQVLLPLAVEDTFTYRIPRNLETEVKLGVRVTVQFGKRHIYTGLITEVHQKAPKDYNVKYLLEVLDEDALVSARQLKFWDWVSKYYLCNLGDVMEAAMPSYLKLKSETHVVLHPTFKEKIKDFEFTSNENLCINALENENELSLSDIQLLLNIGNVMPVIRSLHYKGIILTKEDIKHQYRPKTEKRLRLNTEYEDDETLNAIFEVLESKKSSQKQSDTLTAFLLIKGDTTSVLKRELVKHEHVNQSSLKSLIKKEILVEFEVIVDRWKIKAQQAVEFKLNDYQKKSVEQIKEGIRQNKTVLFHGITGSGKTLVYVQLLKDYVADHDKQALYLVPEIALTTQLINRLAEFYGSSIAVYHSRLSNNERYELWMGIKQGKYKLIVGARSSVFLPFKNLKFVIVDEEHESSFKQHDPAPRYNGRDAGIVLAHQLQIPVILGSATPSIEAYHNAQNGKFHYVYLGKRFGDVKIPRIELIDLRKEQKNKAVQNNISRQLKMKLSGHLEQSHQAILFQNRRGYAPIIECGTCGWVPFCKNCDITLTYHKYNQTLSCHYCGYSSGVPKKCNNCGQYELRMKGTGTERIEDELEILFPQNRVQRMDLDTTRKKNSLEDIIKNVENRSIDILVGTQMVTKGLDFDNVKLVGVISGDSSLHYPDFRAAERTFQMLVQVAGRSGRKGEQGEVVVQTYQPDHYLYQLLLTHNQKQFYATEIQQRHVFKYPPFFRLIKITVRHTKIEKVNVAADVLFANISKYLPRKNIFGPEFGPSPRLKNRYHKILLLKLDIAPDILQKSKKALIMAIDQTKSTPNAKSVDYIVDVDPY